MELITEGIRALLKSDKEIAGLLSCRFEEVVSLLDRYKNEIELFNSAYGLTGTNNTKELIIKHILDSLAPLGILYRLLGETKKPVIADAGSGAGFPGIPLAIAMPNCDFTLIERMGRKAAFLCNVKAILKIPNITVEEGELEKTKKESFNMVTFRAFKPMEPKLLKILIHVLKKGGIIAAYKGRLKKTEHEMAPFKDFGCNWETISYNVPFLEEERHILVIKTN
ncbi:MAG: 16S rRNA (guanine(527)-N(7))-methyltransferase RsmG [Treponema sp.]|jgi:16S rRNA (guanine527-N7)-methyltransferase|nr:16S rRNA (guanine(527)-N(7))-methyltransferase RsmG [Treponema sp.]